MYADLYADSISPAAVNRHTIIHTFGIQDTMWLNEEQELLCEYFRMCMTIRGELWFVIILGKSLLHVQYSRTAKVVNYCSGCSCLTLKWPYRSLFSITSEPTQQNTTVQSTLPVTEQTSEQASPVPFSVPEPKLSSHSDRHFTQNKKRNIVQTEVVVPSDSN